MNLLDFVFDEPVTKLAETFLTVGELAVTQLFIQREFDVETGFADIDSQSRKHCFLLLVDETCSSQPCACRLISLMRGHQIPSDLWRTRWRKRADLKDRLIGLGTKSGCSSSFCLGCDPRQIENH